MLEKLEKQILDFYLENGLKLFKDQKEEYEQWHFTVRIESKYKIKVLKVELYRKYFGYITDAEFKSENFDNIFKKAFEYFKTKGN